VNGRTGGAVAVGRGLAAAWVMRLLFGARTECVQAPDRILVLVGILSAGVASAPSPPGLRHLRVFTAVRWS